MNIETATKILAESNTEPNLAETSLFNREGDPDTWVIAAVYRGSINKAQVSTFMDRADTYDMDLCLAAETFDEIKVYFQ